MWLQLSGPQLPRDWLPLMEFQYAVERERERERGQMVSKRTQGRWLAQLLQLCPPNNKN